MYRWVPTHLHCNAGATPVVGYYLQREGGGEMEGGINTPNQFNGNWGGRVRGEGGINTPNQFN